jgi:phage head maturation protease
MGFWRDLWFGPNPNPPQPPPTPEPAYMRPLNFTLDVPAELASGTSYDGSVEPRIGRAQAMSVPAVKRSRDLICGTLGGLPLRVHNVQRAVIANALFDQPEIDVARSVTMTRTVEDMLFEGRSWWRITEFGWHGYPTKIRRLDPRSVTIRDDFRVYVSRDGNPQGSAWEQVPDGELIRIDSPNDALLVAAARAIRSSLLLDRTAARYANDPLPLGYFAPRDGAPDGEAEEITEMLDGWEEARRERSWGYVGANVEAKTLQWNAEELQLSNARDYAVLEISRAAGLDPEDLGVSTTSRTYANAEQRRLDLLDFTLAAYVRAIEDRLSMGDVLPRGYRVRFDYTGFLRSDTLTRMQTYQIGRAVGVYNDERIAELEFIPSAKQPKPSPAPQENPVPPQANHSATPPAATFSSDESTFIGFDLPEATAEFKVDSASRTISGLTVPWNTVARSNGAKWKFAPNSLRWTPDTGRIKLNKDHNRAESFGHAAKLTDTDTGLTASFGVGRGPLGDEMLASAIDHVYDGFSVEVDFEEGDGWTVDPTDESVRLVYGATLRAVALTAMPAFDSARVAAVAASRERNTMPEATEAQPTAAPDLAAFSAELSGAIGTAVATAFAALPEPQGRQVIPAGRAADTHEPAVYSMNGSGQSLVRDAWKSRTENDSAARDRLAKFTRQTQDAAESAANNLAFGAATTSNAAAVIPPGYRPELYVTQLIQGRPLVNSVSRGTLSDATPFTLPSFTSATSMTSAHTEGTNPTSGTLTIASKTVTPGATSGVFQLTREIVDSSNPAIDAIAMQAMQESYSQQTEAKVYAELNGSTGQGGTITAGFVPSGAQVAVTTGQGDELLAGVRGALALYPFRRFAAPNRLLLSSEGTSAFASAVGTDGRPLLPSVGAQNAVGLGNAVTQGWFVDGLAAVPAWSLSGNAAGDADVLIFNSNDVWYWESALLTFRFEERSGPANIDLALFGYSATRLLRPIGLSALRHTAA